MARKTAPIPGKAVFVVGQSLAHYQITQKIGAGGMGEVYRATDSKLHRDVAIKVIAAEYARDPERMARFEREAHVLASLSHGSIAAVYGLEDASGSKALVMELVEGEDLSDRLRRGPMAREEVLRTAAQIAEALEAAHEHGVIHRDLKPANVKLLADGHVKLLDFGLAKALEDAGPAHLTAGDTATLSLAATRAGIILGTAAYMSPEQATGAAVDRRSDVWSFGVVLFEMLTGRRLFEGETTSHTLAEVIRAEIDFTRLPADTPSDLRRLLERCLQRDPRRRLRDIREARLVLEALVERSAEHSALRTAPAIVQPAKAGWRDRLPWAAAAALAAGLSVAAIATWLWPSTGTPPAQLRVDAKLSGDAFFVSAGSSFALSPDGAQVAFISGDEVGRRLFVRRLDQLHSTPLAGGPELDAPYQPFFSPDGSWIGYVTPNELRKVPVSGGTPLTVCTVDRPRGAAWAGDGTIVLAPSPGSGLVRVSATGGEPQPITTLDPARGEATHRWPQVLPGDRAVLFTSHSLTTGQFSDATIEVVTLATGARKVVHSGGSYGRYVPTGHLTYVNDGTLFAVPFDLARLEVTGPPVPVVQDVVWDVNEGAAQIEFSDSGTLAYMRGTAPTPEYPIVWVDREGRVSPLLGEPGTYANPRLSPDGSRLALTVLRDGNWDIWVYDLERRVMTRLTFDESPETEQVWSPDGREIIFSSAGDGPVEALYKKAADGSGEQSLVATGETHLWATTWSPDGRSLGVTSPFPDRRFDIGIVTLADGKISWLSPTPFLEASAVYSPDGRWLAYVSAETGRTEVYLRPAGPAGGRWQISDSGGNYPRFSRSGRELFYRSNEGIMAVAIEAAGAAVRTGKPRLLFSGDLRGGLGGVGVGGFTFADFDVSPDGSRFVMFPQGASESEEREGVVTLVTNWFGDLSRATTAKGR